MSNRTVKICVYPSDFDKLDTMLGFAEGTGHRTQWNTTPEPGYVTITASFSEVHALERFLQALDVIQWKQKPVIHK